MFNPIEGLGGTEQRTQYRFHLLYQPIVSPRHDISIQSDGITSVEM